MGFNMNNAERHSTKQVPYILTHKNWKFQNPQEIRIHTHAPYATSKSKTRSPRQKRSPCWKALNELPLSIIDDCRIKLNHEPRGSKTTCESLCLSTALTKKNRSYETLPRLRKRPEMSPRHDERTCRSRLQRTPGLFPREPSQRRRDVQATSTTHPKTQRPGLFGGTGNASACVMPPRRPPVVSPPPHGPRRLRSPL